MINRISRRSFGQILGGAALSGPRLFPMDLVAPSAILSELRGSEEIFPFGAHVYREPHLPLDELRSDFPLLKRLGFTMIKVQEVWSYDERRPGEIDLSNVSRVVSDARQNGLGVYFGVTMEMAPSWIFKKFPDAYLMYENGELHNTPAQYVPTADGKPGPCWHHPGPREAAISFIQSIGRQIGRYDNVLVWNVWQEIGFWPMRPGHLGFCFCPYTLAEFRTWLRSRYNNLEALNDTWKSSFGDWNEIEPPRFSTDVPATIDWRFFMDNVYLSDVLRWKSEAFRRSDPLRRPILAHVAAPTYGGAREWHYAEVVDILGSSCYPAWETFNAWDAAAPQTGAPVGKFEGLHRELWESVLMRYDYIRSASRDGAYWTAEMQGGSISARMTFGRIPDASDIQRWILGCLAAGSRGICFWNHRPEPFWGLDDDFALLSTTGNQTDRAEEAGRLAIAINKYPGLFTKSTVVSPQVALVVSDALQHFMEGTKTAGESSESNEVGRHWLYTLRGIYRSLWEQGISCDFVDSKELDEKSRSYKVLIQPFPLAQSRTVSASLHQFVRQGGILISEAWPGRFTEYGLGYPNQMAPELAELFGATRNRVIAVREPRDGAKWAPADRTWGDSIQYSDLVGVGRYSQFTLFPAFIIETLILANATPILTYADEIAGSVNAYGAGRAYLIGTLLGHAALGYNDFRNSKFLASVLSEAGVVPESVGKLKCRRRVLGNKSVWFLFNTQEETIEEYISPSGFKSIIDLLGKTCQ